MDPIWELCESSGQACIATGNYASNDVPDDSSSDDELPSIESNAGTDDSDDNGSGSGNGSGTQMLPVFQFPSQQMVEDIDLDIATNSQWRPIAQCPSWDPDQEFLVGLRFETKENLQYAVQMYSIRRFRAFEVCRSGPQLWDIRCKKHQDCPWSLRAVVKKKHGEFEITRYVGPHSCMYGGAVEAQVRLTIAMLAKEIYSLVKADPSISIAVLSAHVTDVFTLQVLYKRIWLVKQKAIEKIFGGWEESYALLPRYTKTLETFNPGTVIYYCMYPNPALGCYVFQRLFFAFPPSIEAFKHCRPVVSVDATHLYGRYKGKMFIAMAVDANDQLVPLAFAIAEATKSRDNWSWFLRILREDVVKDRHGVCLISDRHAGILASVADTSVGWTEPYGYHRFCVRHLCSNFHKTFKDLTLKNLLYKASTCHQQRKFAKVMRNIKVQNRDAFRWLEEIPFEKWTLAYDAGRRYGIMTTNMSEGFNGVLKGTRNVPITASVQLIFYRLVRFNFLRRDIAMAAISEGIRFPSKVIAKLEKAVQRSNIHEVKEFQRHKGLATVLTGPHGRYKEKGNNLQTVQLSERQCTCGKWQIYRIPCSHVMVICNRYGIDPWQYVDDCFTLSTYYATWAPEWLPIPHEDYWPEGDFNLMVDTRNLRGKGRPRSRRFRNEMDEGSSRMQQVRCGICKERGHNRKTCPNQHRPNNED